MQDKPVYPCDWCGSCPIWLAAYEEGTGLDTEEKVVEACKKYYNCELVGKEVMRNGKV
jgi:hypothetical protein